MTRPRLSGLLICGIAGLLAATPAAAMAWPGPGPSRMSDEEKAMQPDPSRGMQHGVVLLEEAEGDDPISGQTKTSFHLRAKVFSPEARSLGDIQIPYHAKQGWLMKWWGKTICPGGKVLELKRGDLKEVTIQEEEGTEDQRLRAALPGVEPGCVVDYGWIVEDRSFSFVRRIPLQMEWPILHFRYRWLPAADMAARYAVRGGHDVEVRMGESGDGEKPPADGEPTVRLIRDKQALRVEGWNLPAFESEPHMPPRDLVRAWLLFYYVYGEAASRGDADAFWKEVAERSRERVKRFIDDKKLIAKKIEAMGIPADATMEDKLRAAGDWIAANVESLSARTAEEREADAAERRSAWSRRKDRSTASTVLEKGKAHDDEIDLLFLAFARAMGADAHLVRTSMRSSGGWDKGLLAPYQLWDQVIAITTGTGDAVRTRFVDPCSGLSYGEIPWWMTPTKGMLVTDDGYREVVLPVSDPRENILHSEAQISWDEEGAARVHWSSVSSGQRSFMDSRFLRQMDPEDRADDLRSRCGSSSTFEVSSAEDPALLDPTAAFQFVCDGTLPESEIDGTMDEVTFSPRGPWYPDTPSFPAEERVQPVVFDYPFIDMSTVEVRPPEGYGVANLPEPVKIATPFASYALSVSRTDSGYFVQRAFAIIRTTIPKNEYGELRSFLQKVESADRTLLVLNKQGEPEE